MDLKPDELDDEQTYEDSDTLTQRDSHGEPEDFPTVNVHEVGIARVRPVPTFSAIAGNIVVEDNDTPVRILGAFNQRRQTVLVATEAVYLSGGKDVANNSAFLLPANVPITLDYAGEIWAFNDGVTDSIVSFFTPQESL